MNRQEAKQLEIAKKIVKQGNCEGVPCVEHYEENEGRDCPLLYNGCDGASSKETVEAAKAYIKKHSKISAGED